MTLTGLDAVLINSSIITVTSHFLKFSPAKKVEKKLGGEHE